MSAECRVSGIGARGQWPVTSLDFSRVWGEMLIIPGETAFVWSEMACARWVSMPAALSTVPRDYSGVIASQRRAISSNIVWYGHHAGNDKIRPSRCRLRVPQM